MKSLHWIIFLIAVWIFIAPLLGDDLAMLIGGTDSLELINLPQLLRWDDLFLGLIIAALALIIITLEQTNEKTPGLKAMHWMQLVLGLWIAIAPFALSFDMLGFTWSHLVTGLLVGVFALLQISFEEPKK